MRTCLFCFQSMGVQFSITGLATFAVKVYNELLFIIIIIIYYKLSVKAYSLRTDWPQPMIEVYVNLAVNALGKNVRLAIT